jgi:hypothetical protein
VPTKQEPKQTLSNRSEKYSDIIRERNKKKIEESKQKKKDREIEKKTKKFKKKKKMTKK